MSVDEKLPTIGLVRKCPERGPIGITSTNALFLLHEKRCQEKHNVCDRISFLISSPQPRAWMSGLQFQAIRLIARNGAIVSGFPASRHDLRRGQSVLRQTSKPVGRCRPQFYRGLRAHSSFGSFEGA